MQGLYSPGILWKITARMWRLALSKLLRLPVLRRSLARFGGLADLSDVQIAWLAPLRRYTTWASSEDGRIAWRMKRPLPDGTTHLYLTGLELIRRMASLIPAPRVNLTRFHGVFAPGAKLGSWVRPGQQAQPGPEASQAKAQAADKGAVEDKRQRPSWLDWAGLLRRSFALDIFACARCEGRRRVVACLTARQGGRSILEHLGLPWQPPRPAPAQGPPQSTWC